MQRTVATAGRAVFFSGVTVMLGLAGLVVFDFAILRSIGIAGAITVGLAVLASLTLLPALLAIPVVSIPLLAFLVPVLGWIGLEVLGQEPAFGPFAAGGGRSRPRCRA